MTQKKAVRNRPVSKNYDETLVNLVNNMRKHEYEIANTWQPECPTCGSNMIVARGHSMGVFVGSKKIFECKNTKCSDYNKKDKRGRTFTEDNAMYRNVFGELIALKAIVLHNKTPAQAAMIMEQYNTQPQNNHTYHYLKDYRSNNNQQTRLTQLQA